MSAVAFRPDKAPSAVPSVGAGEPVLSIRNLTVEVPAGSRRVRLLDGVDLDLAPGETLAIVGESGSGKSMTCMAATGMLDRSNFVVNGAALFRPREGMTMDLVRSTPDQLRHVRGREIGMIFQDPSTSLNPFYAAGTQIDEVLSLHTAMGSKERQGRIGELLRQVGITDPARVARQFPHELSGGMSQRVMIAMAIACLPALLIADEPTTALDVTIQAQIIDLLRDLRESTAIGMGMVIITHNLGVVAEIADLVAVMYAGTVVEVGTRADILSRPAHPYTRALLDSVPAARGPARLGRRRLAYLPGQPPNLTVAIQGCPFAQRCPDVVPDCLERRPVAVDLGDRHNARCLRVGS